MTSEMYQILEDVKNAKEVLLHGIDDQGELGLLATLLIKAAHNFTDKVFQWMATTYREMLKEKGDDSAADVWKFVSHTFLQICRISSLIVVVAIIINNNWINC